MPDTGTPLVNNYPLKLRYIDDHHNDTAHFIISATGIALVPQKPIAVVPPYVNYLSTRTAVPSQAVELLSKIEIAGDKSRCVELLKVLDNRIRDLSIVVIGGVGGIFADLGLQSKLPVSVIGDGINKLMHLVLIMLANPGAVVLVDEIENGFHYSFFPKLWEVVGSLAVETKCQIIATSHSYECIYGAATLASGSDTFRFVRIDSKDNMMVPHIFDNDAFSYAVGKEWEVR